MDGRGAWVQAGLTHHRQTGGCCAMLAQLEQLQVRIAVQVLLAAQSSVLLVRQSILLTVQFWHGNTDGAPFLIASLV